MGRCKEGREANLVFMQKKEAGKLLREEGSDCIFEVGSPGANPREAPKRRW